MMSPTSLAPFILALVFLLQMTASTLVQAKEICSRVAVINHQEILMDTSSGKKGEGLRFYLEKDPMAKQYLDLYQEKSSTQWHTAAMGTAATIFLATGLYRASLSDRNGFERIKQERGWFLAGAGLMLFNIGLSRILQRSNEDLLLKSIEEYNKRNLPRIYFSPYKTREESGLSAGFSKDF